jgi:hypothetical protein
MPVVAHHNCVRRGRRGPSLWPWSSRTPDEVGAPTGMDGNQADHSAGSADASAGFQMVFEDNRHERNKSRDFPEWGQLPVIVGRRLARRRPARRRPRPRSGGPGVRGIRAGAGTGRQAPHQYRYDRLTGRLQPGAARVSAMRSGPRRSPSPRYDSSGPASWSATGSTRAPMNRHEARGCPRGAAPAAR